MPQNDFPGSFEDREVSPPADRNGKKPVRRSDLVGLVLEPLSAQIDQARLEILEKIREISESMDIIARHMHRQMDE